MSDELYMAKAIAKTNVEQALNDYREAAEAYGMSEEEAADELSDCFADAEMPDFSVVVA